MTTLRVPVSLKDQAAGSLSTTAMLKIEPFAGAERATPRAPFLGIDRILFSVSSRRRLLDTIKYQAARTLAATDGRFTSHPEKCRPLGPAGAAEAARDEPPGARNLLFRDEVGCRCVEHDAERQCWLVG